MSAQRPPKATRIFWETVQLQGGEIVIKFWNGDYTTFNAESARTMLAHGLLSSDDIRAIVRDEIGKRA